MGVNMLASELYALSQSSKCQGNYKCHWCSGPCTKLWFHDDPPPIPFTKSTSTAKFPPGLYVCVGCWLFRRQSVTINFLRGKIQKDRQSLSKHSLLITREGVWGLDKLDYQNIYEILLKPPSLFCLALITEGNKNSLQLATINDNVEVKADTPLHFTINNIQHTYTVYELEDALLTFTSGNGSPGKEPGVRALVNFLGPYQKLFSPPKVFNAGDELEEEEMPMEAIAEKKGRGRPTIEQKSAKSPHRFVSKSGS